MRAALLLALAASACAHVAPDMAPSPREMPGSGGPGVSLVRDWVADAVTAQAIDPNNPRFRSVTLSNGIIFTAASNGIITSYAPAASVGATAATAMLKIYPQLALDSSDYILSIGTALNAATVFNVTYNGITSSNSFNAVTGAYRLTDSNTNAGLFSGTGGGGTANSAGLRGDVANSAASSGVSISNVTTLTAGVDRYITTFYNDAVTTPRARVFSDGTYQALSTVGTAASGTGVTAVYSGASRQFVHKVTVINTAMTAAATTDITIATTPSNTRITRVTANVTQVFTGGALTAVTVQCGNAAGGTQYLLQNSVFTAQNTWGDNFAEVGAGLLTATWADFGTSAAGVPGAITVSCRFTCTTANCNAATQGSVTFYVEGTSYQ